MRIFRVILDFEVSRLTGLHIQTTVCGRNVRGNNLLVHIMKRS